LIPFGDTDGVYAGRGGAGAPDVVARDEPTVVAPTPAIDANNAASAADTVDGAGADDGGGENVVDVIGVAACPALMVLIRAAAAAKIAALAGSSALLTAADDDDDDGTVVPALPALGATPGIRILPPPGKSISKSPVLDTGVTATLTGVALAATTATGSSIDNACQWIGSMTRDEGIKWMHM
jgi:hypothetical protein